MGAVVPLDSRTVVYEVNGWADNAAAEQRKAGAPRVSACAICSAPLSFAWVC
jgi:hypothetical protein